MVKLRQSTSKQKYAKPSSRDQVVCRLTRSDYILYMFNIYQKQKDVSQKGLAKEAEKSSRRGTYGQSQWEREPELVVNGPCAF